MAASTLYSYCVLRSKTFLFVLDTSVWKTRWKLMPTEVYDRRQDWLTVQSVQWADRSVIDSLCSRVGPGRLSFLVRVLIAVRDFLSDYGESRMVRVLSQAGHETWGWPDAGGKSHSDNQEIPAEQGQRFHWDMGARRQWRTYRATVVGLCFSLGCSLIISMVDFRSLSSLTKMAWLLPCWQYPCIRNWSAVFEFKWDGEMNSLKEIYAIYGNLGYSALVVWYTEATSYIIP